MAVNQAAVWAHQDDCLLAIADGEPLPPDALRKLPPWRAVMLARIARNAGVVTDLELSILTTEAREVGGLGGSGKLRLPL